jgi:four helix bundle protein
MDSGPAKRFEELKVWQKAHALVLGVYRYSAVFPKSELYGLASQIRRAAVSVPANIAEGFKRRGRPDKVRFLNIAQGSLEEVRYFLILATDLEYGLCDHLKRQLGEVSRMLDAFTRTIESSITPPRKPN